jgi:putative nucleotidyltransferase-like protein
LRAQLRESLDWSRLAWLAEWERATSVLWRRLSTVAPELVPNDIGQTFKRLTMVSDFHAKYLEERCDVTLAAFAREGIDVILLKGAGLAHSVYRGFTERPMGDLDLLVAPAQARDAWRVAIAEGWQWNSEMFPEAKYEGHHHLPPLYDSRRTGAKLEIHSSLTASGHPFSLGFDEARGDGQPLPGHRGRATALGVHHQVLHLAVHYAWSHMMMFGTWRTFRDLGALAATGRVQWGRVVDLAERHRATSCLYWTYRLADVLTGVETPAELQSRVRPPTPASWKQIVERHLASQALVSQVSCPSEALRRFLWGLAIRPRDVGTARPWEIVEIEANPSTQPRPPVTRRLAWHLENVLSWWRYLRVLRPARG